MWHPVCTTDISYIGSNKTEALQQYPRTGLSTTRIMPVDTYGGALNNGMIQVYRQGLRASPSLSPCVVASVGEIARHYLLLYSSSTSKAKILCIIYVSHAYSSLVGPVHINDSNTESSIKNLHNTRFYIRQSVHYQASPFAGICAAPLAMLCYHMYV